MLGLKEEYQPKTATAVSDVQPRAAINITPLSQLIEDKAKSPTIDEASYWADQVLNSLSDLQSKNASFVHKGIKPQNITVSDDDVVDLKPATDGENISLDDSANFSYLPLEQIWDGLDSASQSVIISQYDEESAGILESPLDARSDIYSLGATFYHLVTKKIPADALTRSIDLLEGKEDPLTASNKVNSDVPNELSDFLAKAMEIRREDRFASAAMMQKALRSAVKIKKPTKVTAAPAVETPKTETPKPIQEKAFAATATASVASIPKAEEKTFTSTGDSFVEEPEAKAGIPKIALVAAGVLVLFSAIFGIWSLSSGSSESVKPPVVAEKPKPETSQPVPTETAATVTPAEQSAATTTTETPATETAKTDNQQKSKEAEAKKAAQAKEAAALKEKQKQQAKTAPTQQKKNVTVEDLLDVDN